MGIKHKVASVASVTARDVTLCAVRAAPAAGCRWLSSGSAADNHSLLKETLISSQNPQNIAILRMLRS